MLVIYHQLAAGLRKLSVSEKGIHGIPVSMTSSASPVSSPEVKQICIARAGGLTREGIGSFFQHIKSSIILSQALNAELYLEDMRPSTHGYILANLFRESPCPKSANASSKCFINNTQLKELLPSICAGSIKAHALMKLFGVEHCTTLYHNVDEELNEGFNDCVAPFYQQSMRPFIHEAVRRYPVSNCVTIGVHIRWGDLALNMSTINTNTALDERSMSIHDINTAWNNIHFTKCDCKEVSVYIKDGPEFENGTFSFGNFKVIDTGDDFLDLAHYTRNDILIQGLSSYGIFGLFSSVEKKVVMTNSPGHRKYNQNFTLHHSIFSPSEKVYYECSGL